MLLPSPLRKLPAAMARPSFFNSPPQWETKLLEFHLLERGNASVLFRSRLWIPHYFSSPSPMGDRTTSVPLHQTARWYYVSFPFSRQNTL